MSEPTRIVLLGKTGAGKSSLANTIFEEKLFNVCPGFESGTSVCEAKTKSVRGRTITLIDSPGFFDTNRSEEELKSEIVRCITECSPGPHAFLIVLKLERFTDQEGDIFRRMTQYFSENVFKYATVVFTHGDDLPKGKTIKNLVKKKKSVSDFIEKCGGRCHIIDNKHWNNAPKNKYRSNEYQVDEILKSIDKTVKKNNGNCYTNEMLQITEELIQDEEKCIAESPENMTEKDIRTEAKNRVYKFLIQAAGITVGALLGAFFGVAIPFVITKSVFCMLKSAGVVGEGAGAASAGVVGEGAGAASAGVVGKGAGAASAGVVGKGAGAAVVAGLAAVGAACGGYEGYEAAKAAETPWEAAEKAAEAVVSKGLKIIEGAQNLESEFHKLNKEQS